MKLTTQVNANNMRLFNMWFLQQSVEYIQLCVWFTGLCRCVVRNRQSGRAAQLLRAWGGGVGGTQIF